MDLLLRVCICQLSQPFARVSSATGHDMVREQSVDSTCACVQMQVSCRMRHSISHGIFYVVTSNAQRRCAWRCVALTSWCARWRVVRSYRTLRLGGAPLLRQPRRGRFCHYWHRCFCLLLLLRLLRLLLLLCGRMLQRQLCWCCCCSWQLLLPLLLLLRRLALTPGVCLGGVSRAFLHSRD